MQYYKNIEIAELYKVSPNTVGNWIEAAKEKKINLQLHEGGNREYILNSSHNHGVLKDLASKGKKYKNSKSLKVVTPNNEFFSTFNEKQIIDIITNLEVYKEIDLKYTYFNGGAKVWNDYVNRIVKEEGPYTVKSTIQLLEYNAYYINALLKNFKYVNIIDIGAGNAVPVKNLLQFFHEKGMLNKYIPMDFSSDLLFYAKKNVDEWFNEKIKVEPTVIDINYENFRNISFMNSFVKIENENCANIILFVGSTIENQRLYFQSLSNIKNSMNQNDIFILGHRLDSPNARLEISFNTPTPEIKNSDLTQYKLVLDMLNITEDMYEIERFYSDEEKSRIIRATLTTDVEIKFNTENFNKTVSLNNRDSIIFFRHGHHNFPDVVKTLTDVGLNVLHATTSLVYEQIMVISKVRAS